MALAALAATLSGSFVGMTACSRPATPRSGTEQATLDVTVTSPSPTLWAATTGKVRVSSADGQIAVSAAPAHFDHLLPNREYSVQLDGPVLGERRTIYLRTGAHEAISLRAVDVDLLRRIEPDDPGCVRDELHAEEGALFVDARNSNDIELVWREGALARARKTTPRAQLAAALREQWESRGSQRAPANPNRDRAILVVADGTNVEDLGTLAGAFANVLREFDGPNGRQPQPAFELTVALASRYSAYVEPAAEVAKGLGFELRVHDVQTSDLSLDEIREAIPAVLAHAPACASAPAHASRWRFGLMVGVDGMPTSVHCIEGDCDSPVTACVHRMFCQLRIRPWRVRSTSVSVELAHGKSK